MNSDQAQALYERMNSEGEAAGYFLNPDVDFVLGLMYRLLMNEGRYSYQACPCRLAEGVREKELGIIARATTARPSSTNTEPATVHSMCQRR